MSEAPAAEAAPEVQADQKPASDPVEAARVLGRFIRCRPGRPGNYCNGRGVVTALVDGKRAKRLCACIENAVRLEQERRDADAKLATQVMELGAEAAELPAPPPLPGRVVPAGARERLVRLKRELGPAAARLADIRNEVSAAVAATDDALTALAAEEAQSRRDAAAAEATKKIAGEQLEEVRARLHGLTAQVEEATKELERLRAQSSGFGARRMELESRIAGATSSRAAEEKDAADRFSSLAYRVQQLLARWPELAEAAAS